MLSSTEKPRAHVLSIQDHAQDEHLINQSWGSDPDIELRHVASGGAALKYLQQQQRKLPNLILLASRFEKSDMTAAETLTALKGDALLRCVPVIVTAENLSPLHIQELYAAGAACVSEISTESNFRSLLQTIKALWLNHARLPFAIQQVYEGERSLTAREKEVLRLIAKDLGQKEIASRLGVSPKTIEFHRQRIKHRLQVTGTAGMVRFAIRNRLLEP